MADPQVLSTLRNKADMIRDAIAGYEAAIETARRDLSAVTATLALFEQASDPASLPAYIDMGRLYRRGELTRLCKSHLEAEGPLDTRELALRLIRAKGLDDADPVLRKRVALRIVHALTQAFKRNKIGDCGRRNGVRVWSAGVPYDSTP